MRLIRTVCVAAFVAAAPVLALADDVTEAIDQARKAYQAGDLAGAKQSLDLASQLVGQKNAEGFAKVLPEPLSGWTAEQAQTTAIGANLFGASSATRTYRNAKDDSVDVTVTGDNAMITQYATLLNNPAIVGVVGKIVKIGNTRGIQTREGDIHVVVANKFLVTVTGSADAAAKMSYGQAVNYEKLSKM